MYLLKRQTAEVSSKATFTKDRSFWKVARKDPAACVSLSSYSLVKQPGNQNDPLPFSVPKGRRSPPSENYPMPFHYASEGLQRRVIAAKRGGRRRWVVYRLDRFPESTEKIQNF